MLIIYGTGGFGRELVRPARAAVGRGDFAELAFVDDDKAGTVMGVPVLRPEQIASTDEVVIAIGNSTRRQEIASRMGGRAGTLVALTALIGPDVSIGEGAVICDYSVITASATIGRHFQCNIYSYVAHDCMIGNFVTFAPRVCCNGNVHIRDHAYIGTGAVMKQGTTDKPLIIGEGAIVGMGAVVTKDVPPGATVIGNPARIKE